MTLTQQYREKMGLSQQELAQYLCVSRSLLTLFEMGKRTLPSSAMLILIEIEKFLRLSAASKKRDILPQVKAQRVRANQQLDKLAKKQAYRQILAKRELEAAQNKYAQKLLLLDFLNHVKNAAKNTTPNNPRTAAWLQMMDERAHVDIKKNGLDKQVMLQVYISGLHRQIDQARLLMI